MGSRVRVPYAPPIGSLAQLNRAFDYGSKGYRFESCGDHKDARLLNTINKSRICFAELAQLVERWLPKPKVTSSSLAFRSQKKRPYPKRNTASSFVWQALTCGRIAFCPPKKHLRGQSVLLHVLSTKRAFPWTVRSACMFCPPKGLFRG